MKKMGRILMIIAFVIIGSIQCSNVAPPGTKITINPDKLELTTDLDYVNQQFVITVTDDKDVPLNNIEITFQFIYAPEFNCPSCAGGKTVEFYDKDNNYVSSPFTTTTDENGMYIITLRLYAGTRSYKGDLEVWSGATGFASVEIKVNAS